MYKRRVWRSTLVVYRILLFNMKVLVIAVLCAWASCAAGGAISWPGAIPVTSPLLKTIIPGHTKTTAYSTTQYINAVPSSYAFAAQPQFEYHHVPQVSSFAALQPAYYQIPGHQYIPGTHIFYPTAPSFSPALTPGFPSGPAFPGAPVYPQGPQNETPSQQAGDSDTAVVDSADFNAEQQRQESESSSQAPTQPPAPEPSQPTAPQFPSNFPMFPQFPQESGQIPSFPQLPQFPQNPGFPQFPQNPSPQEPAQSPPSSFPAEGAQGDKGLNDEDTISVESA